jgi:hypothetical protein
MPSSNRLFSMEGRNFKLIFSNDDQEPEDYEIVALASWRSWNDLGDDFSCRCHLINPETGSKVYFEIFISFLPPEEPNEVEKRYFKKNICSFFDFFQLIENYQSTNSMSRLRFFTMLPTMMDYRKLVSQLGPTITVQVLLAINDLVFFKDQRSSWFEEALNSKVFRLGFMRHSESFFAFSNADSILGGVEDEYFGGISKNLTLKYSLEGFDNTHVVNLKFDTNSLIPKRINILIGKNGVGKSQGLQAFCRAALRYPLCQDCCHPLKSSNN